MWHIYTMEYYAAIRNDEFVSFVGTWMNLENIILSKLKPGDNLYKTLEVNPRPGQPDTDWIDLITHDQAESIILSSKKTLIKCVGSILVTVLIGGEQSSRMSVESITCAFLKNSDFTLTQGHFDLATSKWPLKNVLLLCNPSTLGGRGGQITRSRDRDHPGQHAETPSLLKIQKLAGHGGACL